MGRRGHGVSTRAASLPQAGAGGPEPSDASGPLPSQPRPMNGILVAMTVMNCTLASSGRLAM